VVTTADAFNFELQVGRVLHGRLLGLAVLLRELPLLLLDGWGSQAGAPEWVVVRDQGDGSQVLCVGAGREYGAGEGLLDVMRREAAVMDRDVFITRWAARQ